MGTSTFEFLKTLLQLASPAERVPWRHPLLHLSACVFILAGCGVGVMALYAFLLLGFGHLGALLILCVFSFCVGGLLLGIRYLINLRKTPVNSGVALLEEGLAHLPMLESLSKILPLPRLKMLVPYLGLVMAGLYLAQKRDRT